MWLAAACLALGLAGCGGGSTPDDGGGDDDTVIPPGSALASVGRICGFLGRDPRTGKLSVSAMPLAGGTLIAVEGAAVRTDTGALAVTREDGGFALEGIPSGRRRVEVDLEGLFDNAAVLTYTVVVKTGQTSSGALSPEDAAGTTGAAMGWAYDDGDGGLLLSPVRRSDRRALGGATFTLAGTTVTCDSGGGYLAGGLPVGAQEARGLATAQRVTILGGLTAAGSDRTLERWGGAAGWVGLAYDAEDPYLAIAPAKSEVTGIPRVVVALDSGERALSDASGRYTFYGLDPRPHVVTVAAPSVGGLASTMLVRHATITAGLVAPAGTIGGIALALEEGELPFSVGRTARLRATARDPEGNTIPGFATFTWFSSDATRARIDRQGFVTGLAAGSVLLGASAGGVTRGLDAIVLPAGAGEPARIELSLEGPPIVEEGKSRQLTARVYDSTDALLPGYPVELGSSDASVAFVDSSGLLHAVAAGTCTVRATAGGSVRTERAIQVVASADRLTVSPAELHFDGTAEKTLTVHDKLGGFGGLIAWSATTDQPWLSAVPCSGDGDGSIGVRVEATGLAQGSYSGNVTVDAGVAGNRVVPVRLDLQDVVIIVE